MRFISIMCILGFTAAPIANAEAKVHIAIDLSSQTMHVSSNAGDYTWPVSTARAGYATPRGHYRATSLQRMHYSRKYHMSPMPHSIFFNGGYAIHGTYSTAELGSPASHGCVRLSPGHAARLYELVKEEGADIRISGVPPRMIRYASRPGRPANAGRRENRDADDTEWTGRSASHAPGSHGRGSARAPRMVQPDYIGRPSWEAWP